MELTARPSIPSLARLRPTHADVLFVAIMTWTFVAGGFGMTGLLMDGDTGVHIRIGDWIREHGAIPHQDLFGFSKPHSEWFAYEWLAGVIFSLANSAAGLKGVTLMAATLLSLVPALIALHAIWRGAAGVILVPLVLLGANVLNIHFLARPHIFTLVLLSAAVWMLERDRRQPSNRLWILVPLMALWANLHGGFFIVFPLIGLLAAGCLLERKSGAGRYFLLLGAALAGTFANPYGWKLHLHVLEYLRSDWVVRLVSEAQSPKFQSEAMIFFLALLFTGLAIAGILFSKGRYTEVLWIVFLSYCSLVSVRHATIWVVVLVPILAEEITNRWPGTRSFLNFELRSMTLWPAVFVAGVAISPLVSWPSQFPSELFPVNLVEKHREELKAARVFASDQWSDYLIWRNYPDQQVFMDARHNYFGEKIATDSLSLMNGMPEWKTLVDRYNLNMMLIPRKSALSAVLAERPEWRILDQDSLAVLLARQPLPAPESQSRSVSPLPAGCPPTFGSHLRTTPSAAH